MISKAIVKDFKEKTVHSAGRRDDCFEVLGLRRFNI
jgi:hypothetical protein